MKTTFHYSSTETDFEYNELAWDFFYFYDCDPEKHPKLFSQEDAPKSFWRGPHGYPRKQSPISGGSYCRPQRGCHPQAGESEGDMPAQPSRLRPSIATNQRVPTPSREHFVEPPSPHPAHRASNFADDVVSELSDTRQETLLKGLYQLVTDMEITRRAPLMERAVLRAIHLLTLNTKMQFLTFMVDTISEMTEGTLHSYLLQILHGEEVAALSVQAGEPIHETARLTYGSALDHISAIRQTELGARIRKIFALIFMAGMLGRDPEKQYPGIYKRVIVAEGVEKMDGIDITEEVLNTIRTVWDVVQTCITEKHYGPLLGSTVKLKDLQATHVRLKSEIDFFMNGTYARLRMSTDGVPGEPAVFIKELADHTINVAEVQKRNKEKTLMSVYAMMLLECSQMTNRVREQRTRTTSRRAPFGALFVGRTGVGKSVVAVAFLRDALRIAGLPHSNEYIAWVNTAEAFMTTVTNYTLGVIMDDVANTRAEFQKTDELINIIRISNTACTPVEKADLSDKGTVFHNSQVFVATSNTTDLQAPRLSMEPAAMLRRFNIHVTVRAKERFSTQRQPHHLPMLDASKFNDGIYTRSQEFLVQSYIPLKMTSEQGAAQQQGIYEPIPGLEEWVEYGQMMKVLAPLIRGHFDRQARYLQEVEEDALAPLCDHGYTTARKCPDCAAEGAPAAAGDGVDVRAARLRALETQAGEREPEPLQPPPPRGPRGFWSRNSMASLASASTDEFAVDEGSTAPPPSLRSVESFVFGPEAAARMQQQRLSPPPVAERVRTTWNDWWNPPAPVVEVPRAVAFWDIITKGKLPVEDLFLKSPTLFITCVMGVFPAMVAASFTGVVSCFVSLAGLWHYATFVSTMIGCIYTASHSAYVYASCRIAGMPADVLRKHITRIATRKMAIIMGSVIVGAGAIALAVRLASPKSPSSEEKKDDSKGVNLTINNAAPAAPALVAAAVTPPLTEQGGKPSIPDPVARGNEWVQRTLECYHMPSQVTQLTATREQSIAKLSKQLFNVTITYASSEVVTQAWMPVTNYAIMPMHNFLRESGEFSSIKEMTFTITGEQRGATFKCRTCPELVQRIGDSDLAVVYVGVGGTLYNLVDFVSDAPDGPEAQCVEELSRVNEGEQTYAVRTERYQVTPGTVVCGERNWTYPGYIYQRATPTFKGLCGALLVTAGQFPMVIGMHTMGRNGQTEGRAARLTGDSIRAAIEQVRQRCPDNGPFVAMSDRLFTPPGMEIKAELGELAPRSLLNETANGTSFIPLGTLRNHVQNKPRTRLMVSHYSKLVEEITKMKRGTEPNVTYGRSVNFKRRVDEMGIITQLDWKYFMLACRDYEDELEAVVRNIPNVKEMLRPLLASEVLDGVVGCSSINAMNFSTARGFPFSGNKHSIYEWHNEMGETFRLPTGSFHAEVESALDLLRAGKRANFVFNSNQKDEAKKIGATKCRVFEACPTALIYLTRMYFLPIVRIFSLFPLHTESAVGINASGPEWDALARYIMEYDGENAMAKDWKGFDTSQAYQESKRAFALLIWIGRTFGLYSEDDEVVMWGLAEEICRYIAMFLSDVRMNDGSNSSGNALTVIINNIVHAHRDRAAFYALWARELERDGDSTLPRFRADEHKRFVDTAGIELPAGYRNELKPLLPGLGGRFADYVRPTYYGDDSLASVRQCARGFFNQIAYAGWYAEQGKVVTAADKGAVTEPFMSWDDVTFLKRKFRYDADMGRIMAPLEMESIYKPMHVWPKKQVQGKEVQLAVLIDNASRELFQHGREEFDNRATSLRALAIAAGVTGYLQLNMVPSFDHYADLERDGIPDSAGPIPTFDTE